MSRRFSLMFLPTGAAAVVEQGFAPIGSTAPEDARRKRTSMKVVVVGGVAGGMSFAARARRLAEDAEIVVLERDSYVSYANCGLPYHLGNEILDRQSLIRQTPESLAASLALDVRTGHEVLAIDLSAQHVLVREAASGSEYSEPYDVLILSTGAAPVVPAFPGVELRQVRTLRSVPDVDALRDLVDAGAAQAVVVGAGFIGLEAAEALRRRGLDVTVVELAAQVLPPLDPEMARSVELALLRAGVDVRLATSVVAVHQDATAGVGVELADGSRIRADLVLLAVGVRPESSLAAAAGLALSARGGIVVDNYLQTSAPSVYAVGDAIEVVDAVTGAPAAVPLAGLANRQGRAVADRLFGRRGQRTAVLGTAIVRVFDTVAATTGRNEKALQAAGIGYHAIHLHPTHHAGYYPGAEPMHLKVLFALDGRLLGAQATGGAGVDKRIDIIATAMRAGLRVQDLADLELAYAPPFGSAKDPVNMAGFMAENVLAGDLALWSADELDTTTADPVIIDVRTPEEYAAGYLAGAVNIPHTELRTRLHEIPPGRPVRLYCTSGFRSYLALRVLRQRGWADVRSLSGGLTTLLLARPALALEAGKPTKDLAASTW
jgi:NADPH-dependent 2,4-dienoyl-CoA reductase/sulfur reductase-like enzyme/rhodanese-related sulfurtransferase